MSEKVVIRKEAMPPEQAAAFRRWLRECAEASIRMLQGRRGR